MKRTVITLATALLLGTSWTALAQEQDPNAVVIPDGQQGAGQQEGQAPEQKPEKKRKKREQQSEESQPAAEQQQSEEPQPEKKRKKKQAEQPEESQQPAAEQQQIEEPQPEKKKKKKQQAEQPEEPAHQPVEEQAQQPEPVKKKKKAAEEQIQQQVEQPAEQPTDQQAEQPQPEKKKKKKEQAEQPAEQQPATPEQTTGEPKTETPVAGNIPAEVSQYLSDSRPASELSDAELNQRIKAGRSLSKMKGLPDDVRQELAGRAKQARSEAIAREQGGGKVGKQPEPGQQTTEQPTGQQPEQTTGESKPGTSDQAGVPPEVTQYLSDTRPASELSDAELAERVKAGRTLSRTKGLSDDVRQELAGRAKQARTEALAREQGKGGKQPEPGQQPTAEQPSGEQPTAEKPAGEQPVIADPTKNAQGQEVVPNDQAGQPPITLDKKDVEKLDNNKATPQAEAKAKAFLDDNRRGDQLKDDEAKARLDGMRELLSDNELSRDTKRELRRRLKEERDLYRNRVAEKVVVEEKKDEQRDRIPRRRDREEDRRWDNWAERDILRDRRRSDELEEGELRRRIDIYREAIYDDRYSDDERTYWRDMMDRDRRYLGDRMRRDRDERERYWRDRRDRNEIRIDININLSGDREPPPSAFIDEIDDEELEDYLVTAPRRKVPRRYTVAEIEEEPEIRTAMPAIEIDNIHFGFNEAFLREEEVENLDRIAEVVEKILAAHPDEVFMIEGHTDAVGSGAYNLKLSRERAQAVKKALTNYYAIAPRNLVTAGYGERYLKIPTAEPEEENRRVSFRRVTPLVGEAE
jgi:outer membrane protein OmpA-like peptidoglycan-associated protein/Tfp pilus assembly protein FimT